MRTGMKVALHAAAELSQRPGDRPTGDVWISEPATQPSRQSGGLDMAIALSSPDAATPNRVVTAPAESKFNITLTIRGMSPSHRYHRARSRDERILLVGPIVFIADPGQRVRELTLRASSQ